MSKTGYCVRHPDTESSLGCGRCEQLVCPRCMVHTPVGVRCQDCARPTRVPTFEVSRGFLARAIGAGVALGVAVGFVAGILGLLSPVPILHSAIIVGVGFLIGEGISVAVNRKRGRSLKFVASGSTVIAYVIIVVLFIPAALTLYGLLAAGAGVYIAVNRF